MAFDSTVGGVDANSLVSVADADTYFELRPDGATWLGLLNVDKEVYLVRATDKLQSLKWGGKPTDPTPGVQALQWPRDFIKNRYYDYIDNDYQVGLHFYEGSTDAYFYANDAIPADIEKACCELAMHYYRITLELYDLTEHQYETYTKLNVGGINLELSDGLTADRLPTHVKRILRTFSKNGWKQAGPTKLVRS